MSEKFHNESTVELFVFLFTFQILIYRLRNGTSVALLTWYLSSRGQGRLREDIVHFYKYKANSCMEDGL